MNFPVWEVGGLGSGWVIGLTAVLHVFISHFAIGGGAFLALTEQLAFNRQDDNIYAWLKTHSKFFLLVTTVLGVVTGVGIWWSIGLANPNGTSLLLQNFSLLWGIEYLFFLAELMTFYAYYYTWDRMDRKTHLKVTWSYFWISIGTLVVINGILTFMLGGSQWAGSVGANSPAGNLMAAYFNPGFWPALFMRLFIMFCLAGVYAFLTITRIKGQDGMKTYLLRYTSKWMLPAVALGPVFIVWYLFALPEPTQQVIMQGLASGATGNFSIMARVLVMTLIGAASILVMTLVGPYLNPKRFSFPLACLIFGSAATFMLGEEWVREMMRKPYVIYDYMYSNGIRKDQLAQVNGKGFFNTAFWANQELQAASNPHDKMTQGRLMFRYQCMSCHTQKGSYRSMHKLLGERDEQAIGSLLEVVSKAHEKDNPYYGKMAPVVGTKEERAALAKYLVTLKADPKEGQHGAVAMAH
jgi:cytochrome bd ubiquinol oxidase subunit I